MTPENPSAATRRDWYPVARAVDLDRPQRVTLLGRRLVAFRTADGRPRVLPDRCQHRGGALHRGAVIGDSIECPYHGWQWRGSDGQCVYIPSNGPSAPIPKAAVIGAFPVVERYGLIWTCIVDPLAGSPLEAERFFESEELTRQLVQHIQRRLQGSEHEPSIGSIAFRAAM
jgi:phenylpropionate dioxygenase-like ring-hydroxylating dioxygenase large terminal subunit